MSVPKSLAPCPRHVDIGACPRWECVSIPPRDRVNRALEDIGPVPYYPRVVSARPPAPMISKKRYTTATLGT
jgi:hypothetical protein